MSSGRAGVLAVAVTWLMASAGPAASAAAPAPTPETARLQGPFQLAGRITVARGVLGEHSGQSFLRSWTFIPACAQGACDAVGLTRQRAGGSDQLTLYRLAPAVYAGRGRFFAPLRCGRRTYTRGTSVPFTIFVRVTGATLVGGTVLATTLVAAYTDSARTNLTPCVVALGHDAATYSGQAIQVPGQS